MSDGSVYVVASYALTVVVLVGYGVGLVVRARRVRARRALLRSGGGQESDRVTGSPGPREVAHV